MRRRDFHRNVLAAAGSALFGGAAAHAGGTKFVDALGEFDALSPDAPAGSLTDVEGLKVGHWTDTRRPTGCTVVIAEKGAVAGVDVRGGAPGTRETDLLNPVNSVQQIYAVMLSGGSAFGLDTASGAMKWLDENNIGYKGMGGPNIPIVPAAILYDLGVGDAKIRPNAESGYKACEAATNGPVAEGNVGAGTGATIGKLLGPQFAMKAGLASVSIKVGDTGVVVGAIVAVNAVGDIWDRHTGKWIAGARSAAAPDGLAHAMDQLLAGKGMVLPGQGTNTTLGVVATNAALTKDEATKVAQMAQDGYARAINPVHTPYDGDTIFALSTGTFKERVSVLAVGAVAAVAVSRAVIRAVTQATGIPGFPAYSDLPKPPKP